MKRRTFVRSTLAAAAAATLPMPALAELYRPVTGRARDIPAVTGDGREVILPARDIEDLASRLHGRLLLAGDPGYDESRLILNPAFDRRPALIARVAGTADVRAAVEFAQAHGGLLLAVKCGGHSLSGKSTCERGMMIDLSSFRDVRVEPGARRARVTGGSLLGHLDHESMAYGLVTPMGTVSHTGVGGLVTGGGFGRLARRYGLSVDNLLSVDVVTADGELRHASEDENPDLFWGVRGGGGNFGVVTSFEFQLHPMQRQVVAGYIRFPISMASEVFSLYGELAHDAPDELQLDCGMAQPPGDAPGMAGFGICWSGPEGEAERVLAPIRRLGTPAMDTVQRMDYVALQRSGDITDPRAQGSYTKSGFVNDVSPELVRAMVEPFEGRPDRMTQIFIQHGGGAISRVPPETTAFAQRDILGNMLCIVGWPHGDEAGAAHMAWAREYFTDLEPHTHGFYVNDLELEHSAVQVRENYRHNHDRLVEVKTRYDPTNLFRLNANIQPAA